MGLWIPAGNAVACVHADADPVPVDFTPARQSVAAAPVAPKCYGNGVNGSRIQLLYGFVEGRANNAGSVIPTILNNYVPRIEANFRSTSAAQGREVGIRFHAPGCKITVDTVRLPADILKAKTAGERASIVMNAVTAAGFNSLQRKYLIWAEVASEDRACGTAMTYAIGTEFIGVPLATKPPFTLTDNPTPLNINNINLGPVALPSIAIAWRAGASDPRLGYLGTCWGSGTTGATTETHELLHTLGAVQTSSPNSNGLSHCFDGPDIMCYTEGGIKVINACPGSRGVEQLDCNSDDYFAMSPAVGSYLSTHWNIANSVFLGAAAGFDDIPVDIPRP